VSEKHQVHSWDNSEEIEAEQKSGMDSDRCPFFGHCFGQLLVSAGVVTEYVCQRSEAEKPSLCS